MGANKKNSTMINRRFILSAACLLCSVFVFTGCLSLPGGHQGRTIGGERPGGVHRNVGVNVYYIDQVSSYRGEQFTIRRDDGKIIFRVRGNLFARGRRLSLIDSRGREVYTITTSGSRYKRTYRIYSSGRQIAKVYKKRSRRYERFYINSRRGRDYTVQGNFMNRLYAFFYKGRQVAEVSKRRRQFGDNYRIEISPYQNSLLILASTVIIDMENMFSGR